jgi:hypothetical protein
MPPAGIPAASRPDISDLSGGGGWSFDFSGTSGTTSATSGTTSGTFAEYSQWMNIECSRKPVSVMNGVQNYSLTEASGHLDVYGSELHITVTTYNQCKFINGTFNDTFNQPQKFQIDSNAQDQYGYTYGVVSGPNNLYVFGPQCKILTSQPYIKRELKTANDVEYSYGTQGCNAIAIVSGVWDDDSSWLYDKGGNLGYPYTNYLGESRDLRAEDHTWKGGYDTQNLDIHITTPNFPIWGGGYSTTAEPGYGDNTAGAKFLVSFIEDCAASITNSGFANRLLLFTLVNQQNPNTEMQRVDRNEYYSTGHHSYA